MTRRGMALIELVVGMVALAALVLGSMGMFVWSLRMFSQTDTDIELSQEGALAMRRISEKMRGAMSMTLSEGGDKVTYVLPKRESTADPDTGEAEYLYPLVSDGVTRSFTVGNGKLVDDATGAVLVDNVVLTDPDPKSSQYNKTYAPFQLTTIGSRRALTLNLIARKTTPSGARYVRYKTTTILRNGQ